MDYIEKIPSLPRPVEVKEKTIVPPKIVQAINLPLYSHKCYWSINQMKEKESEFILLKA